MKWKGRPESTNVEDRRGKTPVAKTSRKQEAQAKINTDASFNTALRDKAPLSQSAKRTRGSAGTSAGSSKMMSLQDTASSKARKLKK